MRDPRPAFNAELIADRRGRYDVVMRFEVRGMNTVGGRVPSPSLS